MFNRETEGKKIISFSLWGTEEIYCLGMISNALQAAKFYPSWEVWVYAGKQTTPSSIICALESISYVRIYLMNEQNRKVASRKPLWRFKPAFEVDNATVLVRDADSRFSLREVNAVNDWLKSSKDFHVMRDHIYHDYSIMGGMWGCRNNVLKPLRRTFRQYKFSYPYYYLCDQDFLRDAIYPKILQHTYVHASHHAYEPWAREFSTSHEIPGFCVANRSSDYQEAYEHLDKLGICFK